MTPTRREFIRTGAAAAGVLGLGLSGCASDVEEGAGLTYRPAAETIRDTLAWWREQDDELRSQMRAGFRMPPDVPFGPTAMDAMMAGEVTLLERWRAHTG